MGWGPDSYIVDPSGHILILKWEREGDISTIKSLRTDFQLSREGFLLEKRWEEPSLCVSNYPQGHPSSRSQFSYPYSSSLVHGADPHFNFTRARGGRDCNVQCSNQDFQVQRGSWVTPQGGEWAWAKTPSYPQSLSPPPTPAPTEPETKVTARNPLFSPARRSLPVILWPSTCPVWSQSSHQTTFIFCR